MDVSVHPSSVPLVVVEGVEDIVLILAEVMVEVMEVDILEDTVEDTLREPNQVMPHSSEI